MLPICRLRRPLILLLGVVFLLTLTNGARSEDQTDSAPKSAAAVAARTKRDAAGEKAQQTFAAAKALADKQYFGDLASALKLAMKAGNLDEAKRIDTARKATDAEIAELEKGGGPGHSNAAAHVGTNKLGMKFIRIEAGEFDMGSPTAEPGRGENETVQHVKIAKPFLMATTTVTQVQWRAVMGTNPSHLQGDDRPVEMVSRDDAVRFCEKLAAKDGKHYRLPTEAEWEYACRAGTQTAYSFGDKNIDDFAWYSANGESQTHNVGTKKPNDWGLYDMQGNVYQRCSDSVDIRGGSWGDPPQSCRAACRNKSDPGYCGPSIGFRVCLDF